MAILRKLLRRLHSVRRISCADFPGLDRTRCDDPSFLVDLRNHLADAPTQ